LHIVVEEELLCRNFKSFLVENIHRTLEWERQAFHEPVLEFLYLVTGVSVSAKETNRSLYWSRVSLILLQSWSSLLEWRLLTSHSLFLRTNCSTARCFCRNTRFEFLIRILFTCLILIEVEHKQMWKCAFMFHMPLNVFRFPWLLLWSHFRFHEEFRVMTSSRNSLSIEFSKRRRKTQEKLTPLCVHFFTFF
jgi:hypothetical protein